MPVSVTMPRLGESVTEGTVTRWLKKEGEEVQVDEPLLEVSTDKVDTEIPSPASGILGQIKVAEDETVEVGAELAIIEDAGSGGGAATAPQESAAPQQAAAQEAVQEAAAPAVPDPTPPPPPPAAAPAPTPPSPPVAAPPPPPAPTAPPVPAQASTPPPPPPAPSHPAPAPQVSAAGDGIASGTASDLRGDTDSGGDNGEGGPAYVTPLVRKLAAEHGVDLAALTGTGVGGRIRKQDVIEAAERQKAAATPAAGTTQAAAATVAPSALRGRTEQMSRLRQVVAARMVESLQTSAQLTTVVEVDVTKIARLRQAAKPSFTAREGVNLTYLPFFAVAAIEALKQHPALNASIDGGTVIYHDVENLGVAVDTDRGLVVPVIHNAGDLNLGGLARKIADIAARTRENRVNPDELAGGTFTITNTGSRGALFDTPILLQPQVGVLGTGTVVKRPVVIDDPVLGETIAVRSIVYLALTYDHRLVDGADAARFLATVKTRLEEGRFEAEVGLT